jgi:glucose-specific phosphotransferase system IIA component
MFDTKKDILIDQGAFKAIKAPLSGKIISLHNVSDDAFSDKMVGDGVAIMPDSGKIYAPVDGVVEHIPETLHAVCILTDDGVSILVHVGINTVEMLGLGFKYFVKTGDRIKCGDLIGEVSLEIIIDRGYDICSPIVITNMNKIEEITYESGKCTAAETDIIFYKL